MNKLGNSPLVMGIVNVTPDSFSGDGILHHKDYVVQAVSQAKQMIADGADILDIGGESSRPGATPVSVEEEIRRIVPVIAALKTLVPLAVDTVKAEVAEQALLAGASILNDISAMTHDKRMAEIVVRHGATVVLMHNRGAGNTPEYKDVVSEVTQDLAERAEAARTAGIAKDKIILDPGIGFGKSPQQNLALIAHLDRIKALGFPVLMGVSRKSFIGAVLDLPVEDRLEGTAACVTASVLNGTDILRVHDVRFMARVIKMAIALKRV